VPSGDVSFHLVFRQISKSEPCARSVQAQGYVIENKLPLDMHFELALILLEFPGVETTVGGQAQIYTFVSRQIAGCLRPLSSLKVRSRSYNCHSKISSDSNGNHVFRDLFTQPHAGVKSLGDDIREAIVNRDLDFNVGIGREDLLKRRSERCIRSVLTRGDAHGARRLFPKLTQSRYLGLDLRESWTNRLVEPITRLRGRDDSGRTG
jgi:hypothetical protein